MAGSGLKIPPSTHTVSVSMIDAGSRITMPAAALTTPVIKGMENMVLPCFAFLVSHSGGRKILFDAGIRKDWENLAPLVVEAIKKGGWAIDCPRNVQEVLEDNGVAGSELEALIWSHWHCDHTGDPSLLPSETALVVGPGVKAVFLPGYPANPRLPALETDFAGREVREIAFDGVLKIGRFDAFDYFGDGSFYLLNAPGHTLGHLNALARVTADPPSFVFMGSDTAHHPGEFRPSSWVPLPDDIHPHPLDSEGRAPCPGALFENLLPNKDRTQPFYKLQRNHVISLCDPDVAEETVEKMQEADAHPEILVAIAHDMSLVGRVKLFPETLDDFAAAGVVEKSHWAFLEDFREAVA